MSVRAHIIVHRADGTWKSVSCHWAFFIEEPHAVDEFLLKRYATQAKADKLVKPGDLYFAAKKYHKTRPRPVVGKVVHYGRDRDQLGAVGDTLTAVWPTYDWINVIFVFDKGKWSVTSSALGDGPKYKRYDLRQIMRNGKQKQKMREMEE
jgi:hypothetical protein